MYLIVKESKAELRVEGGHSAILAKDQHAKVVGTDGRQDTSGCRVVIFQRNVASLEEGSIEVHTSRLARCAVATHTDLLDDMSTVHKNMEPTLVGKVVEGLVVIGLKDVGDSSSGSIALLILVKDQANSLAFNDRGRLGDLDVVTPSNGCYSTLTTNTLALSGSLGDDVDSASVENGSIRSDRGIIHVDIVELGFTRGNTSEAAREGCSTLLEWEGTGFLGVAAGAIGGTSTFGHVGFCRLELKKVLL